MDIKLGTVAAPPSAGRVQVRLDGAADAIPMAQAKAAALTQGDRVVCAYISGVYVALAAIEKGD